MKNTIKKTIIISALLFINTSYSIPENTTYLKACTFHKKTYEIIPRDNMCNEEKHVFIEELEQSHDKLQPHNPECFSFHLVVQ